MAVQLYEAGILGGGREVATPQTYTAAMLALGPSGFWKLDEAAGLVAADSSGNGRDGAYVNAPTLGGPSLVRTIARSAHFDGISQVMSVPPNVAFAPGTAFTMGLWSKSTVVNAALMGRGFTGSDLYVIYRNGGNGVWGAVAHAGVYEIADAGVIADDGFRHLYAIRWRSGISIDLLIDGGLAATLPSTIALAEPAAFPLLMGGISDFFGFNFIDADQNCGFFLNYAITDAQFLSLWDAGK